MHRNSEWSNSSNSARFGGKASNAGNGGTFADRGDKRRSNSHDMSNSYNQNSTRKNTVEGNTDFVSSKTGYLTKRSIGSMDALANWRERFFVLADGKLCYYKVGGSFWKRDEQDLAHYKGQIELTQDTVVKKTNVDNKANCFEINTGSKTMFAHANTAKECEDWIKTIRAHVNAIQRTSSGNTTLGNSSTNFERKSFNSNSNPMLTNEGHGDRSLEKDYSRPSLLENHDIVKSAETSNDPKDVVIKQLMEENRNLREQLLLKDQIIREYEVSQTHNSTMSNGNTTLVNQSSSRSINSDNGNYNNNTKLSASTKTPKQMLDLRDIRKKQIQLFDAAENGVASSIEVLLRENVIDVNGVGINQSTALHLASKNNHLQSLQQLIIRGADVTARDADRWTPLHLACQKGHAQIVDELLQNGADPNTTDPYGNGAIHMAAEGGHIHCAKLLIASGAKTDAANASGSLPIHLSPIGHPIRVLLNSGGNISAINPNQPPTSSTTSASNAANDYNSHMTFKNKYHQDLALGPRDFEFVKVLGRGAFAKVYLVRGKGKNRDKWFALKAYNKQAIVQKNQAQYIHTEKAALQACSDHPFIVSLYYAFQSQDRLFLVMEYCGGGDLLSALTRRKQFTEFEAAFYIGEIVLALSHLHSKGIVFRDLKPENVVLDLDGNALLTDFGISKEGIADHSSANTFCGSPMYLAPEMLSRSGHGFALDWYSVGALLFELLTGLPPFYANDKKMLFHNILRGNLQLPDYLSPQAKDLIARLLYKDPKLRLGSGPRGDKEIMEHPFFASLDWGKLYRKEIPPPFTPTSDTKSNGIPDTSNFPQAFTDQEISEIEKGMEPPPMAGSSGPGQLGGSRQSSLKQKDDRKLFQDFDFTPEIPLDKEAKLFEQQLLLHQKSLKHDPAPPLNEQDEYSI